jgi:hypothetical protein
MPDVLNCFRIKIPILSNRQNLGNPDVVEVPALFRECS